MQWFDAFYDPTFSLIGSLALLGTAVFLGWRGVGRRLALVVSLVLYVRYMLWRALYTLNTDDALTVAVSLTIYLAELFGLLQFVFFVYQGWSAKDRKSIPYKDAPIVDIMVTGKMPA